MEYGELLKNYPKLMEGRKAIEANVLGCLFQDILLLKEYKVKSTNFLSDEGKLLFTIANHLSDKNILEITDTDIKLICSETVLEEYKNIGGFEKISILKKTTSVKNMNAYYDDLCKRNLYLELTNDGFDLDKTITIQTKNSEVSMSYYDLFERQNMTTEEVVNFLQVRLSQKDNISHNHAVEESDGYINESFIDGLCEGREMGILFDTVGLDHNGKEIKFLPTISKEILGFKRGTLSMLGAFVNVGKTTMLINMILSLATKGERVLVISNEMKVKDYMTSFLVYVAQNILGYTTISKKKLKSGNLTLDEKEKLIEAKNVYNQRFAEYIHLASIPDSNIDMVERLTRKYALSTNTTTLMYDTFKQEFDGNGEASYKDLIKDSRAIDRLCKKYDLIGLCAIQLSQTYLGNLTLDLSMLAGAKQVNEILWNLIMMRGVYNDKELDPKSDTYIKPFRLKKGADGKYKEEIVDIDKNGTYRVVFLTKTRDGQTYEDSNTATLLRFQGHSGTFKEICSCRPSRKLINQHKK